MKLLLITNENFSKLLLSFFPITDFLLLKIQYLHEMEYHYFQDYLRNHQNFF